MFQYFKKYSIFVCICAIALPVVVSTVWPLFTGQIMASTIGGLVLLFVLFFAGLLVGYRIFGGKADAIADGYVSKYNDACDPEAFVDEGASLAAAITFPCGDSGAWYLGYYAQALLELGRIDEAKGIAEGLKASIDAQKKPAAKVGILVNLLPLEEKLEGPEASLELIAHGLSLCDEAGQSVAQERDFLNIQKGILEARLDGDAKQEIDLDEKIRSNAQYPMRIRVEYAWDEASALYKTGDKQEEKNCLQFVALHGNKLAMAAKAKKRLSDFS